VIVIVSRLSALLMLRAVVRHGRGAAAGRAFQPDETPAGGWNVGATSSRPRDGRCRPARGAAVHPLPGLAGRVRPLRGDARRPGDIIYVGEG
jgi:hypothetical protein